MVKIKGLQYPLLRYTLKYNSKTCTYYLLLLLQISTVEQNGIKITTKSDLRMSFCKLIFKLV